MDYYIGINGTQQGPFKLQELLSRGLRADSLVWAEGMPDWQRADAVPEVAALFQAPASAVAQSAPPQPSEPAPAPNHFAPVGSEAAPGANASQQHGMLGYQSYAEVPKNGFAVASMVLGIVSYPMCIFWYLGAVTAILAIVFGFLARSRISSGQTSVGSGMALAGLILGFVWFGLILIMLAFVLVFVVAAGSGSWK
jgi:hypothetical protein